MEVKNITNVVNMIYEFNWDYTVDKLYSSFRLTGIEKIKLKRSKIAQLIGVIPFIAKCENPDRISYRHLGTYLLAAKGAKDIFNHTSDDDDDILSRLNSINTFRTGNIEVIEKGMKLLALNMVHGYQRDITKDKINNKYNPISSDKCDYDKIIIKLTKDIEDIDCKLMDEYFTVSDAPFAFWVSK